jgi:hypothetical protein
MPEPACNPAAEQCDNLDNDCDGEIDEEIELRPCGLAVGECKPGTISCHAGKWDDETTRCEGEVKGSAERCDDRDNDCDGETDEDVLNECGGCELLVNPPDRTCSAGRFACEASGRYRCQGQNTTECDAEPLRGSADNQCDNDDNDCDGRVDEGGDNGCRGPCSSRLANKPGDRCTIPANSSGSSGCDRIGSWACSGTTSVRCEAPLNGPTVGECGCAWGCNNAQTGESRVVISQTQPDLGTEWLCIKADPNCN